MWRFRKLINAALLMLLLAGCVAIPEVAAQPVPEDEPLSLAEIEAMVIEKHNLQHLPWCDPSIEVGLPYVLPGMERVEINRMAFRTDNDEPTEMLVFNPLDLAAGSKAPVVILPNLWEDAAWPFDELPYQNSQSLFWGLLFAVDGFVTISHSAKHQDDLAVLMAYMAEHADELHIDADNVGFVSAGAQSLQASSYANQPGHENVKFLVNLFGAVAVPHEEVYSIWVDDCKRYGCFYDYPLVEEFRQDLPTLIVRAGLDEGPLPNGFIDHFVPIALEQNLDLTLINVPNAGMGFDMCMPKEPRTQQVFAAILAFMHDSLAR